MVVLHKTTLVDVAHSVLFRIDELFLESTENIEGNNKRGFIHNHLKDEFV